MVYKKVAENAVRVTLSADELTAVKLLCDNMNRTDFETVTDFFRINLMHAQELLDCHKEVIRVGDSSTKTQS